MKKCINSGRGLIKFIVDTLSVQINKKHKEWHMHWFCEMTMDKANDNKIIKKLKVQNS